jgi:hypothetical protein
MSPTVTYAKSHAECHEETGDLTPISGKCVNSGYVHRKGIATENAIFKITNEILNNI